MVQHLPDELWLDIFDMAVEDADFFEPTLPTVFSESSWFKTIYGDWSLRSAQENINNAQRKSYATKKVCPMCSRSHIPCPTVDPEGYYGYLQDMAAPGLRVLLSVPILQQPVQHSTGLPPHGLRQGPRSVDTAPSRYPLLRRKRVHNRNHAEFARVDHQPLRKA